MAGKVTLIGSCSVSVNKFPEVFKKYFPLKFLCSTCQRQRRDRQPLTPNRGFRIGDPLPPRA